MTARQAQSCPIPACRYGSLLTLRAPQSIRSPNSPAELRRRPQIQPPIRSHHGQHLIGQESRAPDGAPDRDQQVAPLAPEGHVRKVEEAIASGDKAAAKSALAAAEPILMRTAQKSVIHKKAASRKVSRLAARLKAMA